MTLPNDNKSLADSHAINNADNENEIDEQALDSVSGGVGSKSSSPFKNYGKGGPVIHTTEVDLGPKQDDPNNGD